MIVKLLADHHLEFVSLKRGCRGSSESTHVKMPHCWKSHATAQIEYKVGVFDIKFTRLGCDSTRVLKALPSRYTLLALSIKLDQLAIAAAYLPHLHAAMTMCNCFSFD